MCHNGKLIIILTFTNIEERLPDGQSFLFLQKFKWILMMFLV
ncbi:hypothetical protein JQM34_0001775 [Streptococcus oralis]|nr:hypothetical protein JQM34_0001775 [Streptococcus oralis]